MLAAFAVLAPAAFAGPGTYYASPTGTGTSCESVAPCALTKAVETAVNEDAVILEPGTYTLATDLAVSKAIELGGQPGASPPVIVDNGHAVRVNQGADARVHDLRVEGAGPFELFSGAGERIFVSFTGATNEACGMSDGATLVDSVCWAHDGGPTATASAIGISDAGKSTTMTLRNDTAIDADVSGEAIRTQTSGVGPKLVVEATNVVARAAGHFDIETSLGGSAFPVTEVKLTHSNYATVVGEAAPLATITAPGTNSNQTVAPAFVDAPGGDFHEAAGSPTIGAGLTEDANGPLALGGEARSTATCPGGPVVTDIGAYQYSTTAPCVPPPPSGSGSPSTGSTTPAPPPAISNLIKVGKLKLNKKAGTAMLSVKIPDAGTLGLRGKGLAKVFRSSKGATTLSLPIKPVGKTRAALAKTGKAVVRLYLTFAPVGGTAGRPIGKTVKLLRTK
ncbi:MAG TPA: hypothetical protein VN671_09885 [Solirubrobacterales bacterium]|nr:hypothetical protein [Solirubrobacterales bacterium]